MRHDPGSTIVDLCTKDLHLESRGAIRASELDRIWRRRLEVCDLPCRDRRRVHADRWERHRLADEGMRCLRGAIGLHLRAAQTDTPEELIRRFLARPW